MPKRTYAQPAKSAAMCKICSHEEKHRVELAIARHVPYRQISREFGVSKDSVKRHRANHMAEELTAALAFDVPESAIALEQLRKSESEGLLQNYVVLRGRLLNLLERAEEVGHIDGATRIYRVLVDLNDREAKLLGEIHQHARHVHINLSSSPEFVQLRSALVRALERHPEARVDVLRCLAELEQGAVDAEFQPVALPGPGA